MTTYFNRYARHKRRVRQAERRNTNERSCRSPGSNNRWILVGLYWLAVLAGLYFAYLNISPYEKAVSISIANTVGSGQFIQLIGRIPLINGIAAFIGASIAWILGLILWAFIQTLEVLPIVLRRDRAFMRTVIKDSNDHKTFPIRDGDDPALAAIKRWYNRFPMLTLNRARYGMLFAYAFDLALCAIVYPPVNGGLEQFMLVLVTGQWNLINWYNVLMTVVMLFSVEAIVRLLFFLGQIAYYMKTAHSE